MIYKSSQGDSDYDLSFLSEIWSTLKSKGYKPIVKWHIAKKIIVIVYLRMIRKDKELHQRGSFLDFSTQLGPSLT